MSETLKAVRGEYNEDGRRTTIRVPQLRILQELQRKGGRCLRSTLIKSCPGINFAEHLGTIENKKNKYTVSLLERRYVRFEKKEQEDGSTDIEVVLNKAAEKILAKI